MDRWTVEFSQEVRLWYLGLTPAGQAVTDRILERLASHRSITAPYRRQDISQQGYLLVRMEMSIRSRTGPG